MRYTKSSWLIILLALSLVLSACNFGQEPEPTPDVGVIFTAAAETVVAQYSLELTQTAQAAPTITPVPTSTVIATFAIESPVPGAPTLPGAAAIPSATLGVGAQLASPTAIAALSTQTGPLCNDSAFVADINYFDGSVVEDDVMIEKVWSIQNTGTCTWDDGYSLVPVTGDAKGTWKIDEKKEFVDPGEIIEIGIDMRTPTKGGDWGGCWKMQSDSGQLFGTFLCLLIKIE